MRVIARIPDVSEAAAPAEPADAAVRPRPAPARPTAPRPRPRTRGLLAAVTDAWPTWPVAALAVVAVMTWILASWNDHARLERQRSHLRLAREPAVRQVVAPTGTSAAGAVVR